MTTTKTKQGGTRVGWRFVLTFAWIGAAPSFIYAQAASQPGALVEQRATVGAGAPVERSSLREYSKPGKSDLSTPTSARKTVVALDIGHSAADPGCISAYGRSEYTYNKEVVERISAKLTQSESVKPVVVNPSGHTISLRLRTELARKQGAELFLSVHHDAAQPKYLKPWMVDGKRQLYSEDFRGYGVFVSQKNPFPAASRAFGTLLGKEMHRAGFQFSPHHNEPVKGENRPILDEQSGLYRYDDLIVLKSARMPAALLECGVIIHPEEARILAQSDTQEKIAQAAASAIEQIVSDRANTPWR